MTPVTAITNGNDRIVWVDCEMTGLDLGADALIGTIRDVTKLRAEVAFRAPGELPNDGKVIEDTRRYD